MVRDIVAITFDSDGLTFHRVDAAGQQRMLHQISAQTLQQMNMVDLEYSLSTNILMEMPALRAAFADYLWSADGQVRPLLEKSEPRLLNNSLRK